MADTFKFTRDDARVKKYLTTMEINGVTTWQNTILDYEFEFHTMHTIGNPVYLREKKLGLGSNLPKIDTKDKTATTVKVVNPERISNPKILADFTNVVKLNLPLFQKLAKIYYEGEETGQAPKPAWVVEFSCSRDGTAKTTVIKLPPRGQVIAESFWPNFRAYAKKPDCPLHKTYACVVETVRQLPALEAGKVKKLYDENGEVIET